MRARPRHRAHAREPGGTPWSWSTCATRPKPRPRSSRSSPPAARPSRSAPTSPTGARRRARCSTRRPPRLGRVDVVGAHDDCAEDPAATPARGAPAPSWLGSDVIVARAREAITAASPTRRARDITVNGVAPGLESSLRLRRRHADLRALLSGGPVGHRDGAESAGDDRRGERDPMVLRPGWPQRRPWSVQDLVGPLSQRPGPLDPPPPWRRRGGPPSHERARARPAPGDT